MLAKTALALSVFALAASVAAVVLVLLSGGA